MKNIVSLILLMLLPFMAFAQNGVYTSKFGVTVRNLPRYYVQPQSRNYSLVCSADRQVQHHVSFDQISDELHFAGWKRLSSPTNAYMKININLKSMLIDGFGVKENIIDTRDRFGHPIKIHTFQGVINYTMVTTWTVRTPSENFSSNPNVSYAPKAFTPEREFDTPGAAMDYVRNNRDVFRDQIINDEVMSNIYEISDLVNQNYIYNPVEEPFDLYFFYQKKNRYYSLHRNLPQKIKAHLAQINENGGMATTEIAMEDIIKHFKTAADSYSFANKKERKARYAMLYNLCVLNYVFENFDEAKRYAQMIVDSGYNKMTGRHLLDVIADKQNRFIKHNITTQHFEVY